MGVYINCRFIYLLFYNLTKIQDKMRDVTEYEKGQNVGAPMAGASDTKTAELLSYQGP